MIKENLEAVYKAIDEGKQKAKYTLEEPANLVAVSKTHPVEAMLSALDLGVKIFGENKVQEAKEKYKIIGKKATWHLIGHLQSNKVKTAVEIFDLIQSVDSYKLAEAINKEAQKQNKVQNILLQVNLTNEETKFGLGVEDVLPLAKKIDEFSNVSLQGLMYIAPNLENKEELLPLFEKMYYLYEKVLNLNLKNANIKYLSMGMSDDFPYAIYMGANLIRIGSSIFGKRDYSNKGV